MIHAITQLPILILYPHSRCNCRCLMCDIWKTEETREIDLERHLADIAALGVRWVIFSGGEPLMHSDFFALCRQLRGLGVRLTVLSTGLLLAKYAKQLVEHVDDVIVSLDGTPEVHNRIRRVAGAFELLSDGVRAIHSINPAFPVAARCTVQKQNHGALAETAAAARTMGLASISFLAADLTSTAFNRPEPWTLDRQSELSLTAAEVDELEKSIERLADIEPGFILESPEKLRRIVRHFRAHLGQLDPVAPRCNAPWVSAVVESDGTVRPCFFHDAIGKVGGAQSLAQVLNGPRALEFRRSLDVAENPTCRRCVCSLFIPP